MSTFVDENRTNFKIRLAGSEQIFDLLKLGISLTNQVLQVIRLLVGHNNGTIPVEAGILFRFLGIDTSVFDKFVRNDLSGFGID